jgi:REP element-mobilizing transposase RayT
MSEKYKFYNEEGLYFATMTTVKWIDVFTRTDYKDIIIDSMKYCIAEKGLIIYAYVIMSNHLHFVLSKKENTQQKISDIIRDFKKYTAMHLIKAVSTNPSESRKKWMLWMFRQAGSKNCHNTVYQFWQQKNHPIELETEWIDQKIDYIHRNPVKAGWVLESHEYYYSSARNYEGLESPIKICSIDDGSEI